VLHFVADHEGVLGGPCRRKRGAVGFRAGPHVRLTAHASLTLPVKLWGLSAANAVAIRNSGAKTIRLVAVLRYPLIKEYQKCPLPEAYLDGSGDCTGSPSRGWAGRGTLTLMETSAFRALAFAPQFGYCILPRFPYCDRVRRRQAPEFHRKVSDASAVRRT